MTPDSQDAQTHQPDEEAPQHDADTEREPAAATPNVPARTQAAIRGELPAPAPLGDLREANQELWELNETQRIFHANQLRELSRERIEMARRHRKELADLKEAQARELENHDDLINQETITYRGFEQATIVVGQSLNSINVFVVEPVAKTLEDGRASAKKNRLPKPETEGNGNV